MLVRKIKSNIVIEPDHSEWNSKFNFKLIVRDSGNLYVDSFYFSYCLMEAKQESVQYNNGFFPPLHAPFTNIPGRISYTTEMIGFYDDKAVNFFYSQKRNNTVNYSFEIMNKNGTRLLIHDPITIDSVNTREIVSYDTNFYDTKKRFMIETVSLSHDKPRYLERDL